MIDIWFIIGVSVVTFIFIGVTFALLFYNSNSSDKLQDS